MKRLFAGDRKRGEVATALATVPVSPFSAWDLSKPDAAERRHGRTMVGAQGLLGPEVLEF